MEKETGRKMDWLPPIHPPTPKTHPNPESNRRPLASRADAQPTLSHTGEGREFAFLTSSQVVLLLLARDQKLGLTDLD